MNTHLPAEKLKDIEIYLIFLNNSEEALAAQIVECGKGKKRIIL